MEYPVSKVSTAVSVFETGTELMLSCADVPEQETRNTRHKAADNTGMIRFIVTAPSTNCF